MGTCYSKTGHEMDPSMTENRPKEKKGSSKNGHLKTKNRPTLIIDQIQKDVSDTVYTEDSHTVNALDIENCINKSQQTSLDHLAKDLNRSPEVTETSDSLKPCCNNVERSLQDNGSERSRTSELVVDSSREEGGEQVVASDSGIDVETNTGLGSELLLPRQDNTDPASGDEYSEKFELSVGEERLEVNTESESNEKEHVTDKPFQPVKKVQSPLISRLKQSGEIKCHNSGLPSNVCCNGENRRSISSLDRLSESRKSMDSATDLDKIKLVLRQASVSSTEQRYSSTDPGDTSYELPCVSQPEITTMTMNGRDVVVIDAELFSQITDEIQFLKMKLSQLTEVIQESEAMSSDTPRHGRSTPLSSVSSVS